MDWPHGEPSWQWIGGSMICEPEMKMLEVLQHGVGSADIGADAGVVDSSYVGCGSGVRAEAGRGERWRTCPKEVGLANRDLRAWQTNPGTLKRSASWEPFVSPNWNY